MNDLMQASANRALIATLKNEIKHYQEQVKAFEEERSDLIIAVDDAWLDAMPNRLLNKPLLWFPTDGWNL